MSDGLPDYFAELPHEVVGEYDANGRLAMQRVAYEDEDAYTVDIVLVERYLRLEMRADGDDAGELAWDARTTLHDPDEVHGLGKALLLAAEWMREHEEADDAQT